MTQGISSYPTPQFVFMRVRGITHKLTSRMVQKTGDTFLLEVLQLIPALMHLFQRPNAYWESAYGRPGNHADQ